MTKEALKLALEALQKIYIAPEHEEYIRVWWPACEQAITAIKEALANEALEKMAENARELGLDYEPEQDWIERERAVGYREGHMAALAQRTWIGLTDEDFLEACQIAERGNYLVAFQRIQAALKAKNT